MNRPLMNKIVLITGASSGIGEACALHCAKEGANIILAARRIEKLEKLSKRIEEEFQVHCYVMKLDVTHLKTVDESIQHLPQEWKKIEILINNAGLALGLETFQAGKHEDWDRMIDTNIKGLLYVTRAVLPDMIVRQQGHIVNIGSISGHETYSGGVVYCLTKHAVTAMSEGLRKDLLGTPIRVSLISPGMVKTEFSKVRFKEDETRAEKVYEGLTPLYAEDIAEAVVFCITRKPHINIKEIFILPTDQASTTMVHRK